MVVNFDLCVDCSNTMSVLIDTAQAFGEGAPLSVLRELCVDCATAALAQIEALR